MASGFGMILLYAGVLAAGAHPEWLEAAARVPPAPPAIEWATIPAGDYKPLFPSSAEETSVKVGSFRLATKPVTNGDYLRFVSAHPQWQRGSTSALRADPRYLVHWQAPLELDADQAERPVVNVSWFAARAYCEWLGARLPTEAEWEYVAAASEKNADGRKDPEWSARILRWYASPSSGPAAPVGKSKPNFHGVYDLHGSVWEWVSDFDGSFVIADSRRSGSDADDAAFCGGGALRSSRPEDYASFMRVAYRSSLQARFVGGHLGFRCARDVAQERSRS
jgi:formylglycine-generating enzyme required for sulfatase activity